MPDEQTDSPESGPSAEDQLAAVVALCRWGLDPTARDARMRAEGAAAALREAAKGIEDDGLPGSHANGAYRTEHNAGYLTASRHAAELLRARADREETDHAG